MTCLALLPGQDARDYRTALSHMVGFIDLILSRDDLPDTLRQTLTDNWRVAEARELLMDTEGRS